MSNEFIVIPPEDRNLKIIDYNDYNAVHNAEETDESLFNGIFIIYHGLCNIDYDRRSFI